jgi:hypothetical protein
MKEFDRFGLTYENYHEQRTNAILTKMFWFDCNCKYNSKIWIQLKAGFYRDKLLVTFDVCSSYNDGWSSYFNEIFLADKYKLLEPFIYFFDQESITIEKEIKKHPLLRLNTVLSDFLIIDNCIKETHDKLMNYFLNEDYEKNWKKHVRFSKKMKVFEEDIFPGI